MNLLMKALFALIIALLLLIGALHLWLGSLIKRGVEQIGPRITQTSVTLRDVAAHAISYDRISALLYVPLFVVSGFSIDRTNRLLVRWWRRRVPDAIIEAFRRSPSPRRMMRLLGRRIALLLCS